MLKILFMLLSFFMLSGCFSTYPKKYVSNECRKLNYEFMKSFIYEETDAINTGKPFSAKPEQNIAKLKAKGCYKKPFYYDRLAYELRGKSAANGCKDACFAKFKNSPNYEKARRYRAISMAAMSGK